jgi:hypothetical protein
MPWTTVVWLTYCGHPRRILFIGWLYIRVQRRGGRFRSRFRKLRKENFTVAMLSCWWKKRFIYLMVWVTKRQLTAWVSPDGRQRPVFCFRKADHFVFGSCMPSNTTPICYHKHTVWATCSWTSVFVACAKCLKWTRCLTVHHPVHLDIQCHCWKHLERFTLGCVCKRLSEYRFVHIGPIQPQCDTKPTWLPIFIDILNGVSGGAVFEALRYKLEGRGFDSRWCHWNFSLT